MNETSMSMLNSSRDEEGEISSNASPNTDDEAVNANSAKDLPLNERSSN
jgi:hypothetical protein